MEGRMLKDVCHTYFKPVVIWSILVYNNQCTL